jgi:hypothetical protein
VEVSIRLVDIPEAVLSYGRPNLDLLLSVAVTKYVPGVLLESIELESLRVVNNQQRYSL